MEIFAEAKLKMRGCGNMHQWEGNYPSEAILENDIRRGFSYVLEDEGLVVATFVLAICPEPTYNTIYEGAWIDDEAPYGTIHRIASCSSAHGLFGFILNWCFSQIKNIRIDTHRDNAIMRHLMDKHGFDYCGIIYLESGDERLAYQKTISFRGGRPEDASFIAECILAGVGAWDFSGNADEETMLLYRAMASVCGIEDSLYSYCHCRIAQCNGKAVGCMTSYPGDDYARLRELTWSSIHKVMGGERPMSSDYETGPGEYYLDTLALAPEFRGFGLGKELLLDSAERARAAGYERITLIVEQDHPKLISYYESIGFQIESQMTFLGEAYFKCVFRP